MVHKVVIVGGGAGGLELAAKLGRRFGPDHIFLVDAALTHVWKPSLHEVAAGTLDIHREGLSYPVLARDSGFTFLYGAASQFDRERRLIVLDPVYDSEGQELFSRREVPYDTLVLAVGSQSNYFGTPGAIEFAMALDSTAQAESFRQRLLRELVRTQRNLANNPSHSLHINIVGGGATGVELAAELVEACKDMRFYGLEQLDPARSVRITLLEGGERVLPALPARMSQAAHQLLLQRGIQVKAPVRVASVTKDALFDTQGNRYPSDICVWAAGIEAPAFLAKLGLPLNRINQVEADLGLRTADPNIYAIGDCAQVPWKGEEGRYLPARAQVAHQQASFLLPVLSARIRDEQVPHKEFEFKDYGSLVSVGHNRGVGSLMGVLSGKSWFVEGLVARTMYMSLHLMHHMAVLGFLQTVSIAIGRLLLKRSTPRVKLH